MFTEQEIDRLFRPLRDTGKIARYPLTNIAHDEDGNLIIEVAIAGFDKNDIRIEMVGNELSIVGQKSKLPPQNRKYIQSHISVSDFTRTIILHENYIGGDITAEAENGILTMIVTPVKQPKRQILIN